MNILNGNMGRIAEAQANLPPQLMQSIRQLKQMQAMCNGDMNGAIQRIIAQNPQMAQAMQIIQGQNPETIVRQMCKQKGIDCDALIRALRG